MQRQQEMQDMAFQAEMAEKQAKVAEMRAKTEKPKADIRKMVMDTMIDLRRVQNEEDQVELNAVEVAARIESLDISDGATVIEIARRLMEMENTPPPVVMNQLPTGDVNVQE